VIPVNQSFSDPQMGDQITIADFVPNFQLSQAMQQKYENGLNGGTMSLLHVIGTGGNQYANSITDYNFRLSCGANQNISAKDGVFDDEMTAAGFTPLPLTGIKYNGSGDGYIAFMMPGDPNPTGCVVKYTRAAATAAGGKAIPEFTTTITLN